MIKYKPFLIHLTLIIYLLLSIPSNLNAQTNSGSGFVIDGKVSGAKDGTVVKLVDIDGQSIIDSAIISNSNFVLKGQVSKPTSCWIRCDKEYAIIQVENTHMTFSSPYKDMKLHYAAKGGREQALQNELDNLQRGYEKIYSLAYDSLDKKLFRDSIHRKSLIKIFNSAQDTYMDIYVAFGRKYIDSYLGLDIVYRNRKTIPKDSLILLYNTLSSELKSNGKASAIYTYATERLASKGERFLDFEVRTIKGSPFKLSNLKGKYIYLTFGSFSCGPCRMENKEIADKYAELKKNIEIVNFSLDVNRKEWEAAAKKDGIVWYDVSDMGGMSGKVKTLYNVQAMPTSFLIDPNGIIVERFEGYDDKNITKIAAIASKRN